MEWNNCPLFYFPLFVFHTNYALNIGFPSNLYSYPYVILSVFPGNNVALHCLQIRYREKRETLLVFQFFYLLFLHVITNLVF